MEEKKNISRGLVYGIAFTVIVLAIAVYALLFTDVFSRNYRRQLIDFTDNWRNARGEKYSLDAVDTGTFGGSVHFFKGLPGSITDRDSICFTSRNANISLVVDGEEIYRYSTEENITGMGYGENVHIVGLSKALAGKTMEFAIISVSRQEMAGAVGKVYIGTASDYFHYNVEKQIVQFILNILIIFFGIIIILVWAGVSDKSSLPIDIVSLGIGAAITGVWLLSGSSNMQLLTGRVILWRVLNRLTIFLVPYPFVRFFNSITRRHRKIYDIIAFYISIGLEAVMIAMWLVAGIDTATTYTTMEVILITSAFVMIGIIIADNYSFCKKNSLPIEHKWIYLGLGVFMLFFLAELVVYKTELKKIFSFGTFARIGMLLFIMIVLFQFLKWWMKDQAAANRDRFINRSLQFAVGSKSPDESIRLLLEYLGRELGAKRAYIFEDNGEGKFVNTGEWQIDEEEQRSREMSEMPYRGCIDRILISIPAKDNCIVVEDKEQIKTVSPILYDRMKKIGANSMVAGPLELNGKLIGLLGINDVSAEHIKETTEIMGVVSFFFIQFINQRKEQERMLFYSFHDPLSGAKNRSSLKEFTEEKFDMSQAFGYVLCEVEGLKDINETLGHDAGDELVANTARSLMDAFGDDNVYRLSGEEFAAFGFESDETYFDNDVERAKRLLFERGCHVSIGAVFCSNGATSLHNVQRYARMLIEKKKNFPGDVNYRH